MSISKITEYKKEDFSIKDEKHIIIDTMDIPKICVIVVSENKAKIRTLPNYGEYRIVTHQGKVKRMRKEEGEEF